jgi:NTE family protein
MNDTRPPALARAGRDRKRAPARSAPPGQIVLVFQGGGALGAYQVGVYQALHEAGIEPDWVIGTSIGAINAAIIAGNPRARRMERLERFWESLEWRSPFGHAAVSASIVNPLANLATLIQGVNGFFAPRPASWWGLHQPLGVENAAYYDTSALKTTLEGLIDFDLPNQCQPRLSVGAVNVRTGSMRYFDSRFCQLRAEHVMASGALPPAFPAIRIDGEPYWDGGVYSNTPIEAVLDDDPRKSSTIFSVHLWNPSGTEPETLWQVMGRQKDIQYASRATNHIDRQKQLHRLRHVITGLADRMPKAMRNDPEVRELASWGCRTTMHIVRLLAPRLMSEDHPKDIDFTPNGIHARWKAGYEDMRDAISQTPWRTAVGPLDGVVLHEHISRQNLTDA